MNKRFFILMMLVAGGWLGGYAQPGKFNQSLNRVRHYGIMSDTMMGLPKDTFRVNVNNASYKNIPWLGWKNQQVFVWDTTNLRFNPISVDSVYTRGDSVFTRFYGAERFAFLKTAGAGVFVDTIYARNDSLLYKKDAVEYFVRRITDTESVQDAVGAMINASLQYVDGTPLLAINDRDFGDMTTSGGGLTWTIDANAVTYDKMQNISTTNRLLGRINSSGDPEELTGTEVTGILDLFTSSLKGLVPASGGGTTNFLRADGTWTTVPEPAGVNLSGTGVGIFKDVSGGALRFKRLKNIYGLTITDMTDSVGLEVDSSLFATQYDLLSVSGITSADLPLRITGNTVSADTAVTYNPSLTTNQRLQKIIDSLNAAGWASNIYNSNGSLTGARTVTGGANTLSFTGTMTGTNAVLNIQNSSSGSGIKSTAGSGFAIEAVATSGYGYVASTTSGVPAEFIQSDGGTNNITDLLVLRKETFSTAANGIGGRIKIRTETDAGTLINAGQFEAFLSNAANGSRISQMNLIGINLSEEVYANFQTGGIVRVNNNADTLATKAYARSVGGSGGGEANTASNLGGGLANWDSKSGVDLRFNTFDPADFDLAANLITIDATKWLTISAGNSNYLSASTSSTQNGYFGDINLRDDTSPSHYLTVTNAENLTANRTLSIVTGDASRTLTFAGNATISNTNSGDVTLAGTPDYITISGQVITRGLIDLATDVTGDLPFANLTQIAGFSVLGKTGTGTGDVAAITAGADQVLRRSGSGDLLFGTLVTNNYGANTVTFAKMVQGAANTVVTNPTTGTADFTTTALSASNLLGRGSTGNIAAITVGGILSFSGTVLSATEVDGSTSNELQNITFGTKSGADVPLDISSGTGVTLTEGSNVTITRNSATQITISATGGSGEANTISSLGGGLDIQAGKSGVDLRVNTLLATDFDVASNLISIDYTNGQKVSASVPGFMTAAQYKRNFTLQTSANPTGTITHNQDNGGQHLITFTSTGGRTLAFSNLNTGDITVFTFDNTSGSNITLTLPANSYVNYVSASDATIETGLNNLSLALYDGTNYYFTQSTTTGGGGDMLKSTYDTDTDNIVDNSEQLEGQAGSYYLSRANHTGTQALSTLSNAGGASDDIMYWNGSAWTRLAKGGNNTVLGVNGSGVFGYKADPTGGSGITINSTSITSGTPGRLLFENSSNQVSQSSNLFWDNSNNRLGIGTSSPAVTFHTQSAGAADGFNYNHIIESTGAYSTSPSAGVLVRNKYNSGGSYAGMGGWNVAKENPSDGDFGSSFNIFTRPNGGSNTLALKITSSQDAQFASKIYVGNATTNPTARLHLAAHSTTANTAPIKLTSGTAMTTPEDGAFEYHSSHLYFTIGSTRYQLDQQGGGSGLGDPGGNGIVVRTALNTTTNRSIAGTTNEISISNGDGVSGNPTVSLASTLDLYGKTITVQDNNWTMRDDGDNTKTFQFGAGLIPTSTSVLINVPGVNSTLVGFVQNSEASNATPTPAGFAKENEHFITAQAAGATFSAPSGTPLNGNYLLIRIKDNGTARSLAWNSIYRGGTNLALPTTTTISKTMYIKFIYNSTDSKWD